jgi:hypothetical protein
MSSQPKLMVDVELVEAVAVNEVGVLGDESVVPAAEELETDIPASELTLQIMNV